MAEVELYLGLLYAVDVFELERVNVEATLQPVEYFGFFYSSNVNPNGMGTMGVEQLIHPFEAAVGLFEVVVGLVGMYKDAGGQGRIGDKDGAGFGPDFRLVVPKSLAY